MSRLLLLVLLASLAQPLVALADEAPRAFIMAIWPDRVRILDEETEQFVDEFRLRHGGVTERTHTPDRKRFFFVTDRMESVEVVEPGKRQVVDELKLSTPERKVRLLGLAAHPNRNLLYISTRSVQMEVDRFEAEEPAIILYDLDTHAIKKTSRLPNENGSPRRPTLRVSRDGTSLFVFGSDIHELDAETLEITDKIVLSDTLMSGYGPFEELTLSEAQPDVYYGIYLSKEPFLEKSVFKSSPVEQREVWENASPIARVSADAPPFLVIHGTHDSLAWVEEARLFVEALREKSQNPALYAEIPGAQHAFDTFHSIRSAYVIDAVISFLERVHAAHTEGATHAQL